MIARRRAAGKPWSRCQPPAYSRRPAPPFPVGEPLCRLPALLSFRARRLVLRTLGAGRLRNPPSLPRGFPCPRLLPLRSGGRWCSARLIGSPLMPGLAPGPTLFPASTLGLHPLLGERARVRGQPRRGAGVVAQHASAGYPVAPQSLGAAYPVRPSAHPTRPAPRASRRTSTAGAPAGNR